MKNTILLRANDQPIILLKNTLLIDIDGTLAEFRSENTEYIDAKGKQRFFHYEDLFEKGYFRNLPTLPSVNKIKELVNLNPNFDIAILSSVLADSEHAVAEKIEWVREHLGDKVMIYLTPCGTNKSNFFETAHEDTHLILLDDYSTNLHAWVKKGGFEGIKARNCINGTHGSWQGLDWHTYTGSLEELVGKVVSLTKKREKDYER